MMPVMQVQVRLQQAESLIRQQRLTIDRLFCHHGRNSKQSVPVGHMRQSENAYWRSWLQSSADCTAGNGTLIEHTQQLHNDTDGALTSDSTGARLASQGFDAVGGTSQEVQVRVPHTVGLRAPTSGSNSLAGSSVTISRNARQRHQKQKHAAHHQVVPLGSNTSLVNVMCSEEMCPGSGCHSCGWKSGMSADNVACQSHSCLDDVLCHK